MVVEALVALLPVVLFLALLLLMDSFELVRPAVVGRALAYGAAAAVLSDAAYEPLLTATGASPATFSRWLAPLLEEAAKAGLVAWWIGRRRVGFLVDAAILGFASGTGFALVENAAFLRALPDAGLVLWAVRGLGTAVLHGATTSVFAMIAKTLVDRRGERDGLAFVPGWAAASAIHAAFNHVLLPPVAMTALLVAALPPLVVAVFQRSERATREWVCGGLDVDVALLDLLRSELFAATRFGAYLRELRARFPGLVVADMFCLLRVQLELSIQAKSMLMVRNAGGVLPPDEDVGAALAELAYLQASIGRTGMLALKPLEVTSDRDRWHRHLLADATAAQSTAAGRRVRIRRGRQHTG